MRYRYTIGPYEVVRDVAATDETSVAATMSPVRNRISTFPHTNLRTRPVRSGSAVERSSRLDRLATASTS